MAALNYDEPIVLILFAQFDGNMNPTQSDIAGFDAALLNSFDATAQRIMGEEGLGVNTHNRSLVLGCRPHMAANTPEAQIRAACRYILVAQQAVSAGGATGMVAAPAGASPGAAAARRPSRRAKRRPR